MGIIGIDIGGTKIRGVLWTGKRVIRALEFPTPKNKNDFKKGLLALSQSLAGEEPIVCIGIGAAGILERTKLISSPNIPYIKKFDFRTLWPRAVSLRVDNDARCFARAEFLRGSGRRSKSLFGLTIGTGVGRAYGKNGEIIKIKRLEYPERWEKKYQAIRNTQDDRRLANFLGEKLSSLLAPYNPEVIVVGGGVTRRQGLLRGLQEAFKSHGLQGKTRRATLGNNTVAIGAALLCNE